MACPEPLEPPPPCLDCPPPDEPWPDPPPPRRSDPLAQSFRVLQDSFVTSIDLYFAAKDEAEPNFWVSIREVVNGIPTDKDIAVEDFTTANVTVSADASVAFNAKFSHPVFCERGKEYCFVVGGWSPKTRLWIARMGETLINDATKIVDTQPATGSSFRSQNGSTWTPEQFEDIKYTIYVAEFDTSAGDMEIVLEALDEREALPEDPFECQAGSDMIRVHCPDHGLASGDKFRINMFEASILTLMVDSGSPSPMPGQIIYTQSGRAKIREVTLNENTGKWNVEFSEVYGQLISGETFTTESEALIDANGNSLNGPDPATGTIEDGNPTSLAGIPVSELVQLNYVEIADTPDSFLFRLTGVKRPTSSGRFGGKDTYIQLNFKFDVFNVSGSHMLYQSTEKWELIGIGHNPENGIFSSQNYIEQNPVSFTFGSDVFLDKPLKFASDLNKTKTKSAKPLRIRGKFKSTIGSLSPMINLNTVSATLVSNRIAWLDGETMNVAPNATARYLDETNFNASEPYKYVTKMVTLKNPATDLMIAVDAYKDKDADFDIYYKLVYANSPQEIDSLSWTQVPIAVKKDGSLWTDRYEYELLLSDVFGAAYDAKEFSSFKIKLVGRSKNSAKPPVFSNLRVIAIT